MNEALQSFLRWFWLCSIAGVLCGAFAYILIWRRPLWLRLMDAEESFWQRFGLPRGGFTRRFGESRFFTISIGVFAVVHLLLAATCAALYFYYRHRLQ